MIDVLRLLPAALAGAGCGAGFFGGLWWTIRRSLRSNHAALWFFASSLLRTGGIIAVFAGICRGDLERWLACIGGFFVARVAVQILGRAPRPAEPSLKPAAGVLP